MIVPALEKPCTSTMVLQQDPNISSNLQKVRFEINISVAKISYTCRYIPLGYTKK